MASSPGRITVQWPAVILRLISFEEFCIWLKIRVISELAQDQSLCFDRWNLQVVVSDLGIGSVFGHTLPLR